MRGLIFILFLFLHACGHTQAPLVEGSKDLGPTPNPNPNPAGVSASANSNTGPCPQFRSPTVLGRVTASEITEASGIVASRKNAQVFWIHNDSGDTPRLFAVGQDGRLLAVYSLEGAEAQDWEDIAIGPGPSAGSDYLYAGDIGSVGRPPRTIYQLLEPEVRPGQPLTRRTVSTFDRISFVYPSNSHYDAETLFVDPTRGDIFVVTKTGDRSYLFQKSAPHQNGKTATLELMATIYLDRLPSNHSLTGGDIDITGNFIALRTYTHAFIWRAGANGDLATAFHASPCVTIDLADEPQGEAIAFTPTGGLVTLSEQQNQPIYFYRRR